MLALHREEIAAKAVHIALWPLTIWASLAHLNAHPADDYVARTFPIIAAALGFWAAIAMIATLWFANGPRTVFDVFLWMTPVIYVIGAMLFAGREEKFPQG